jgi:adhesin transport system outer membrane protein
MKAHIAVIFSWFVAALLIFGGGVHASTLREVVKETLSGNPEVLAQVRETQARDRQVRQALGGFYPDVDILGGYGFQERDPVSRLTPGSSRNELERTEWQLSVRQMVFDGFETWNEYQNQQAREESAEHRIQAVAEQVSLDAIEAYINILKRKAILDLADQTLAFHQDIHQRMKKRFDSGAGSRADLDQISSRLAFARTNYFNAQANLIDARTNFQRVVGRLPNEGELEKPDSYRQHLPETLAQAVERARQKHPIVAVAMADLEAVQYQYERTKAAFYPQFHVDIERDHNNNIDGLEGHVDDLKVMLRMRYNLYNGRSDQARRQQFAHLVEKAREVRNNAIRQVREEVRLAWVTRRNIEDQIPSLERYVRDSEATKKAYLDQYDLGRRTLLDLLNTENENIDARKSLISAQYDLVFNEYRLFQSMGELLWVMDASI